MKFGEFSLRIFLNQRTLIRQVCPGEYGKEMPIMVVKAR